MLRPEESAIFTNLVRRPLGLKLLLEVRCLPGASRGTRLPYRLPDAEPMLVFNIATFAGIFDRVL
jgi:hypothetical protein